ncbi:MAG TPA: hypothetical protein VNZ49_15545 [Bacteroidia bacterium]|jgi:hypothetical protein|nr:hypothetical protein [Bacteroidia bacterium]
MKKVLSIIALSALATSMFVACGPSEAEKKKLEEDAKRVADSLATAIQNSIQTAVDTAAKAATDTAAAPAKEEKK